MKEKELFGLSLIAYDEGKKGYIVMRCKKGGQYRVLKHKRL